MDKYVISEISICHVPHCSTIRLWAVGCPWVMGVSCEVAKNACVRGVNFPYVNFHICKSMFSYNYLYLYQICIIFLYIYIYLWSYGMLWALAISEQISCWSWRSNNWFLYALSCGGESEAVRQLADEPYICLFTGHPRPAKKTWLPSSWGKLLSTQLIIAPWNSVPRVESLSSTSRTCRLQGFRASCRSQVVDYLVDFGGPRRLQLLTPTRKN